MSTIRQAYIPMNLAWRVQGNVVRVMNKRNLRDFFNLDAPLPMPQMPQLQPMPTEDVQRGVEQGNLVPADGFPYFGGASGAPGMNGAAPLLQ